MAAEGGGPHADLSAAGDAAFEDADDPVAQSDSGPNGEGAPAANPTMGRELDWDAAEPPPGAATEPGASTDSEPEPSLELEPGPPAPSGGPVSAPVPGFEVPRPAAAPSTVPADGLARRLFEEGYRFDFYQAVRLLQRMQPGRARVGLSGPPRNEAVRFRARISMSFPPSSIYELRRPTSGQPVPEMVQAFMGLTGPSGVLPRHYSELLYRIDRLDRSAEKHALRDWFDLFNHRMVSLFYRAWEKYRFYIPFERGDHAGEEPDRFTAALLSLIGLGHRPLRGRLNVVARDEVDEDGEPHERVLARIEDLVLLRFGGLLGHRPRCAVALETMLGDQFRAAVRIEQFRGQWLKLELPNRTRLGGALGNNEVGASAVAGRRVWDRQSKFRVRLGPMNYAQFVEFLPDRAPVRERKTFFLLAQLVRLYVDPGLDFDVQLVLKAEDVPACHLTGGGTIGARLGWNTWLLTRPATRDAEDVVINGEEAFQRGGK